MLIDEGIFLRQFMSKWSKETSGIDIIRRIASKVIKKENKKERIWSHDKNAWGYFHENPDDLDEFLLWCCIAPGDRLVIFQEKKEIISTVLALWKDAERNFICLRVLDENCKQYELTIQEHKLFKTAWSYLDY